MGKLDILSLLLHEIEEEENEAIMDRIKVLSRTGRITPLRQVYRAKDVSRLIINLQIDMAITNSETEKSEEGSEKIWEGDELPHQTDELRPEEIMEYEQEPPRIITAEDRINMAEDLLGKLIMLGSNAEAMLHAPSPHAEDACYRFYRAINKKIEEKAENRK